VIVPSISSDDFTILVSSCEIMDASTSERAITCLLDQIDELKTTVSSLEVKL
jgi:hypothetical protein